MIRHLRALAWLRWRLLVNGLRGSKRRDPLERLSRFARLGVPAMLLVTCLSVAGALTVLGAVGGWAVGAGKLDPALALRIVRLVSLVLLAVTVFMPIGRATYAAGGGGATRLLLLPIPRATFHRLEVLASLADPWLAVALPGIVLFALGLVAGGQVVAGAIALAAACALVGFLAALGSLIGFLMTWLMRSRRRSETFTLAFVLLMTVLAFVPTLLANRLQRAQDGADLEQGLPAWTVVLPSELFGRSIDSALAGRRAAATGGVAGLLGYAAAAYALSSRVHRRLLDATEVGRTGGRGDIGRALTRRMPGLGPAVGAVAVAQARTALRSVRGRLVVLLTGPATAAIGFFARRVPDEIPGGDLFAMHGHVLLGFGIVFSLYALQAFSMNQFAADRSGLTLQFLAPISDREIVRGKLVGCAAVLACSVLFCAACALLVLPGGSPWIWLAVLLGTIPTYLLVSPLNTLLSALLPVASDLSKTGSGGNPHGVAMLAGTLAVLALSTPAAAIVTVAYHWMDRPALALLLMLVWTGVAALIALPMLDVAARAVGPRRENLALVAQGR